MAPNNQWSGNFKFPIYHGDPEKHPSETWQGYEDSIQLVYISSGIGDGLSDEIKKAHLLYGLDGRAKKERELHKEWMDLPLEELKRVLRSTFNKPRWRDLTGIENVVQKLDESCREYASRLRAAIQAFAPETDYTAVSRKEVRQVDGEEVVTKKEVEKETEAYKKVTDKILLNYFIRNLRTDLRKTVVAARPRTMSEALEVAEAHEQYVEMIGGFKHIHLNSAEPERALNLQVEPAVAAAAKQLTEMNNRPYPTAHWANTSGRGEKGRQNGEPSGTSNYRCYACNQPGHFQRECPERDTAEPANYRCHECDQPGHFRRECPFRMDTSPAEIQCRFCGKKGHMAKECYSKLRQQEQQKRRNIWTADKKKLGSPPPPRRMSILRRTDTGANPGNIEKRAQWTATGRHKNPNEHRPRREIGRGSMVQSNQSKNGQRGGQRGPMNQTLPRPFARTRKPTVKWQV